MPESLSNFMENNELPKNKNKKLIKGISRRLKDVMLNLVAYGVDRESAQIAYDKIQKIIIPLKDLADGQERDCETCKGDGVIKVDPYSPRGAGNKFCPDCN